jgi:hypothetical protein
LGPCGLLEVAEDGELHRVTWWGFARRQELVDEDSSGACMCAIQFHGSQQRDERLPVLLLSGAKEWVERPGAKACAIQWVLPPGLLENPKQPRGTITRSRISHPVGQRGQFRSKERRRRVLESEQPRGQLFADAACEQETRGERPLSPRDEKLYVIEVENIKRVIRDSRRPSGKLSGQHACQG